MTIAIYSGSFDPITLGHLDIIQRASQLFSKVIVVVTQNRNKSSWLSLEKRKNCVEKSVASFSNVQVIQNKDQLAVDIAKEYPDAVFLRGVRSMNDFENEWTLSQWNQELGGIDTLFLPAKKEYLTLSSSYVRELFSYGTQYQSYVPKEIWAELEAERGQNG